MDPIFLSKAFYNVRDYGATGSGQLETARLQQAIDDCAARGGGTVFIPAGRYLTGTLFLRDDITLYLDAGAVLAGSEDVNDYPVMPGRWEGAEQLAYAALISGAGLTQITVTGRGTIDGCGQSWWRRFKENSLLYPRPRLMAFTDCQNVLIEGITLTNSPSWTLNPVRCENVNIHNLTIINPPDSPNTDGINPDSCRMVRISDCYVSVGDDCITLKSGTELDRPDLRSACEDITITNCTLERGHGGVVIGSEMSGDVRNVVISNCVFVDTDRGIRLKSRRGRGGIVENIRATNIIMEGVLCPFTMNLYYGCGAWGNPTVSDKASRPVDEGTPHFRHIHFSHITAREVKYAAAFVYGLAEQPVDDISFSDVDITIAAESEAGYAEMADGIPLMQQAGFFARNIRGLSLNRVKINGQVGPAFDISSVEDVEMHACSTRTPQTGFGLVQMNDARKVFIHACRAGGNGQLLLALKGSLTEDVVLSGNEVQMENRGIELGENLRPDALKVM